MTVMQADIDRLLPILDAAFQAQQARMGQIIQRTRLLKGQLAELDRPSCTSPLSAAVLAGADLRWESWAQNRKAFINQELALVYRDREAVRNDLAMAFSKREAAKKVQARAAAQTRQIEQRRASW